MPPWTKIWTWRSERHDQVELISRKPGGEAVDIHDETPFTPLPLVILFGGSDVRWKEPAEIVHTPPSKYRPKPKYSVSQQRYKRTPKPVKTIRKSAGILPTPLTAPNPAANMPDNLIDRSVPVVRKVLLHHHHDGTPRVAPQDGPRDHNANAVPGQVTAGVPEATAAPTAGSSSSEISRAFMPQNNTQGWGMWWCWLPDCVLPNPDMRIVGGTGGMPSEPRAGK